MKTFRWLAAGAVVILLAALVLWRTSPQQAASRPLSQQETAATPVSPATPAVAVPAYAQRPTVPPTVTARTASDAIAVFENWARQFSAVPANERPALLSKGEELARARHAEMAKLIRQNPEQAIARALPYSLRKQLPENILGLIEYPVSARGDFRPIYYKPLPGRESEVPPTGYEVVINKQAYETYTYGERLIQPAHN